ncbi:hypothetical protein H1C71_034498, partial [Ictidomys tridecemlineatus]
AQWQHAWHCVGRCQGGSSYPVSCSGTQELTEVFDPLTRWHWVDVLSAPTLINGVMAAVAGAGHPTFLDVSQQRGKMETASRKGITEGKLELPNKCHLRDLPVIQMVERPPPSWTEDA